LEWFPESIKVGKSILIDKILKILGFPLGNISFYPFPFSEEHEGQIEGKK